MNKNKICEVAGCNKQISAKNLCNPHYRKMLKYGDPLTKRQTPKEEIRSFLSKSLIKETDDCIPWPFGKNGAGYGVFQIDGEKWLAHRYIAFENLGPPPSDKHEAAHMPIVCHNRKCINKRHIFWATRSENQNHMILDKTMPLGDNHKSTKISDAEIIIIRSSGKKSAEISREYKISQPHASRILNNKRRKK